MKYTSIAITACVLAFTAAFFIIPKKDFSENENRYLAKAPELSIKTLLSGEYTKNAGTYLSDRFPARDGLVACKTLYEKNILAKRLINNIYICSDGSCAEKFEAPENTDDIGSRLNALAEKTDAEVDIMLVPTAAEVYSDRLPAFAVNDSEIQAMQKILDCITAKNTNIINVYDTLMKHKNERLYYSYDHHWTTEGAYLAVCEYLKQKGFESMPDSSRIQTVCNDFKGTVYSKLNDYTVKGEEISAYIPENTLSVKYDGTEGSLYSEKYLSQKDKYSYFLDNQHALTEIENKNAVSDREIVIIKDSYANCFIPFLADYYKKIYAVDTRYYKKPVSELINASAVNDVLILYNIGTIGTDMGINGIY